MAGLVTWCRIGHRAVKVWKRKDFWGSHKVVCGSGWFEF